MNAEILTVGTELLLGDILNSNSQFLSREMAVYGIDILYQSTVGDNAERLENALTLALGRCDTVILTGGLGPTEDDLTRETVAAHFNLPLVLHEESDRRIREYFENTGREYAENNQKQAMLPEGCVVFPNDHGTAPGCAVEKYGQTVILLPGPPGELIPMFTQYVAPYLSARSGGTIQSHTIGVFGIPESVVDERLQDLMKGENPTVAPYAKDGEVVLRVTAKAENAEEADALCRPVIDEIRERLGAAVYGVDAGNLQKTVVSLLKEKGLKIATAESCTAGMLSGRLTQVAGVSEVFECGVAAYSKEIKHQVLGVPENVLKEKGAVSPETAAAMAVGARKVGEADIGIGITGVAGPEPSEEKAVGTVYVALADDRRVWVKKIFAGHGGDDREYIRYVATSHALDMARRYLEAFPGVMAGGQMLDKLYAPTAGRLSPRTKKTLLISALILILVAALLLTYTYVLVPHFNQQEFDKLWEVYLQQTPDDGPDATDVDYPDGILAKFMSLYRVNDDIRGWLTIPDSEINYPVVQEPEDGYYENHDFYGSSSLYGVPYIDKDVAISPTEENRSLVIYGNNPPNEQMFAQLTEYAELAFLREHGTIEMNTLFRNDKYKVFAVMIVGDEERYTDNFDYTMDTFADEDEFLYYVSQIRQRSLFDTPVGVGEGDDLLLLTTPIDYGFDGARIVVAARRVRLGEDEENDLSRARVNTNVLMPLAWQIQQGNITVATTAKTSATETTTTTTFTTEGTVTTTDLTTVTTTAGSSTDGTGTVTTTTGKITTSTKTETSSTAPPTTTTTTPPTSTTTPTTEPTKEPEPVTPPADGLTAGTVKESEFMSVFAVKNTNSSVTLPGQDANGVIRPTTKEQLQYVLASITKAELGSASTMVNSVEAQKAQAVASYSFILYQCKNGTPYEANCKAINLSNKTDKKIFDAVGEVLGVKVINTKASSVSGMLLSTFYHSSSGGYTSSCNRVWGGALSHAVSVASPYDNELTVIKYSSYLGEKFVNTVSLTRDELYSKVKAWVAKNCSGTMPEEQFTTDDSQLPLQALSYDGNGKQGEGEAWNFVYQTNFYYVKSDGAKVYLTGHNIRSILGLRSHAFRVEYDASNKTVAVTTQGYGHGVGMSQMGAVGYANEAGWTYVQILKHYYSITGSSDHQVVAPVW